MLIKQFPPDDIYGLEPRDKQHPDWVELTRTRRADLLHSQAVFWSILFGFGLGLLTGLGWCWMALSR